MNTLQVREAKAAFSSLIAAAENGQPTLITRHGQPMAMVVPVAEGRKLYPDNQPSFADYLLAIPESFDEPDVAPERNTAPLRDIDL